MPCLIHARAYKPWFYITEESLAQKPSTVKKTDASCTSLCS